MAINIKNPEVEAKIKRIARLRGESLTGTIDRMADEDLKSLGDPIDLEALNSLLTRTARLMKDGPGWRDIDSLLYDHNGLPK